ncbi:MAG: DNA repair protein RecN [Lachnospiraceae bacterium]|nr:DNA repair protein RecN [Lachnospiraceae bacterium]
MLLNLHVKNIALINDVDMSFTKGFNVLSGETGAGKSLIIDSVNFALGGRLPKDIVRNDSEQALCELTFLVEDKSVIKKIEEQGIYPEDGIVVLSRKIVNNRGLSRINGETVSAGVLKAVSSLLIDIHGQHEHQSLLYKSKHLEILDEFLKDEISDLSDELRTVCREYNSKEEELSEALSKSQGLEREKELLRFEIDEITDASLSEGEDLKLESLYKKMINSKKILEALGTTHSECGYESENSAGSMIGRSLGRLRQVEEYDETIRSLAMQLTDIDGILNDFNRSAAEYAQTLEFSNEEFEETEHRLNTLNHIKAKYGNSITGVLKTLDIKKEALARYEHYEEYTESLEESCRILKEKGLNLSAEISAIRKRGAGELSELIQKALLDLNFLNVEFETSIRSNEETLSPKGYDEVEFMISTNPGEKIKPLTEAASGGELSRIMLALKTVLADKDNIETLIFDEIDTGISGRTAQKVSEKLAYLSLTDQVICITHLPQIAAMADAHYEISKSVKGERTETEVRKLEGKAVIDELARMLSGAEITDNVLNSAEEMKKLAEGLKEKWRR